VGRDRRPLIGAGENVILSQEMAFTFEARSCDAARSAIAYATSAAERP
jgi:hypothetical protein